LQEPLAALRGGVMLHYDDSSDDDASLAWFQDPHCSNGYTWLVLDDGRVIELADPAYRTPHAGPCLTPRANSVFYGIAAATNGVVPATPVQVDAIVEVCTALFHYHGWTSSDTRQRIVGHDAQAIWTLEQTRLAGIPDGKARLLWGKLGRKVDPTGQRRDGRKILDVEDVRAGVRLQLLKDAVRGVSHAA
jgi:N-acetyl-anhydromuramyl-L-alanine amidase AmpD